jgi:hypothetical protein
MRWLPDRRSRQHWALRLFQIAQGTALSAMFLVIAIVDFRGLTDDIFWFWCAFAMFSWVCFWARFGWAVTLTIAAIVLAGLLTPTIGRGGAEWGFLMEMGVFGIVGLAVGGVLDAIGLATRAAVDYSKSHSLTNDPPKIIVESNDSTSAIRGDEK